VPGSGVMQREAVVSSVVSSVGYRDGTLEIEFVSGNIYRYLNVPERLFHELCAPSRSARSSTSGSAIGSRPRARSEARAAQ